MLHLNAINVNPIKGERAADRELSISVGSNNNMTTNANRKTFKMPTKQRNSPTATPMWSAFLTNLGICALLIAYTLLGKYCSNTTTRYPPQNQLHPLNP